LRIARPWKVLGAQLQAAPKKMGLRRINEVVRMIVQEFIGEGKALPEGPLDSVEVEEASQQEFCIAVTF
jgi:hypothetical protein